MTGRDKTTDAPAEKTAPEIPAGKARVVIAADFTNPSRVGKTVTLPAEEARVLVAEGRARYHRDHLNAAQETPATLPVVTVIPPTTATA
jgi:hypothetical protein